MKELQKQVLSSTLKGEELIKVFKKDNKEHSAHCGYPHHFVVDSFHCTLPATRTAVCDRRPVPGDKQRQRLRCQHRQPASGLPAQAQHK